MNNVINTELGRYLEVVTNLAISKDTFISKAQGKIKEVNYLNFKDFAQGRIYSLYD